MLKMQSKNGVVTITDEQGAEKFSGTLSEAITYIFYLRFICLVKGERISTRIPNTAYPIKSLLPPTRRRIVKVYVLGKEAAV